jgi:hypothetical protein
MRRFAFILYLAAVSPVLGSPQVLLRKKPTDVQPTAPEAWETGLKWGRKLDSDCGGCDYVNDPICATCLLEERLIVSCNNGDCLYTNECFARESGIDPKGCTIVGTDP